MRFRVDEPPWGAARFAYSYLGVLGASLVAGVVMVIASPIIAALPVCQDDEFGLCMPGVTGIFGLVAMGGLFFLAGFIARLGWKWAAWMILMTLILGQIVIETSVVWLLAIAVVIPAMAAMITFARPDREPNRKLQLGLLGTLILGFAQFLVWLIVLAAT
ncbi:MAG: hypothetical protein FWD55_00120 [Propionibacteriaceae bacterium]|nr:hypothetical protein [Propionibacteriaceae bacterium]